MVLRWSTADGLRTDVVLFETVGKRKNVRMRRRRLSLCRLPRKPAFARQFGDHKHIRLVFRRQQQIAFGILNDVRAAVVYNQSLYGGIYFALTETGDWRNSDRKQGDSTLKKALNEVCQAEQCQAARPSGQRDRPLQGAEYTSSK